MAFTKKIFTIDEALLSKEDFKENPDYIDTVKRTFEFEKYKGVRRNILRPLFRKIAEHYGVPLLNNGKTLIFDYQNLKIDKDSINSRQLNANERAQLINLLYRYGYTFNESLFLVGNVNKKNGDIDSLINAFNLVKKEIEKYQSYQNDLDKNLIREKKIEKEISQNDKIHIKKTEEERKKILASKKETLTKLKEKNEKMTKKLEQLRQDEAAFNLLQNKIYTYRDINYKILITYIPWRVASMSTFTNRANPPWSSCMNLEDGVNKHYVGSSISNGAFVAYLIRPGDEENINNPIARVLIKPFIRLEPEDENYEEDDYEDDERDQYFNKTVTKEIEYLDPEINNQIFWYVDLVYPRGQFPAFRSKVVEVFSFFNKASKSGTYAISTGQYVDSRTKIIIDDIFEYVNSGNYSDIETKSEKFISQMIQRYPIEFFSNWPKNTPLPKKIKIRGDLDLIDMDLRSLPENLNIDGKLTITNINITKIKSITCKSLYLSEMPNDITVENCEIENLDLKKLKNKVKLTNTKIGWRLSIEECDKIKEIDGYNLKELNISLSNEDQEFSIGSAMTVTDRLHLKNIKIKKNIENIISKAKDIKFIKCELNKISGEFDHFEIQNCQIKEIKNIEVKYNCFIKHNNQIEKIDGLKIGYNTKIENEYIKEIKNVVAINNGLSLNILCKNLEKIDGVNVYFFQLLGCENIKNIKNINCDSVAIDNSKIENEKDLINIKCKELRIKKNKLKNINNLETGELELNEVVAENLENIKAHNLTIVDSEIKTIKNINFINIFSIKNIKNEEINNIEGQKFHLYENKNNSFKEIKNIKCRDFYVYKTIIEYINGLECENFELSASSFDSGFVDKLSNTHIKKQFKVYSGNNIEIGENVVIGDEKAERSERFNLSALNIKKISPDFKAYGTIVWKLEDDITVFPKMTIKGELKITSVHNVVDIEAGADIDYFDFFFPKIGIRTDEQYDKMKEARSKIIKKITTLEKN